MKAASILKTTLLSFSLVSPALANTHGSVEPIANAAVIDTRPLRDESLRVREALSTPRSSRPTPAGTPSTAAPT